MPTSKTLTEDQIRAAATANGIEYAALRAVIDTECKGQGFQANGDPKILFERHKFYGLLFEIGKSNIAVKAFKERPDICNPESGGYGLESAQHGRLQAACTYDRTTALESASWGIGQVMGSNWITLGYPSLQTFINAMYKDEASQLDAMIRYIKVNKLTDELARHDWAGFAKGYNGLAYAKNKYDLKLKQAYAVFAGAK
mgnify:CR=1 FL=1